VSKQDNALESEFTAKFFLQNYGRKRGGQVVARHLGCSYVSRHDHLRTGLDSRLDIRFSPNAEAITLDFRGIRHQKHDRLKTESAGTGCVLPKQVP
jgi:hypothetical protein